METREQPDGPIDPTEVVQLKVHGGLGDVIWVIKKFVRYDKPIFLHVSDENRARPRRSGILADHLPNIAGWRFDPTTFCRGGQDWGPPSDPACAIGRKWSEIKPKSGQILRLECNKHLESGKRIDDWLPDLPTTHHFEFRPPDPPERTFERPYAIFHLAGWPDVPDVAWQRSIDRCRERLHVYIVGGSYDGRPQRIRDRLLNRTGVNLLEDLPWPELYALLIGATYCFGHASGFTALADVLKIPGVVINPRQHPRLMGMWNSSTFKAQLHLAAEDFEPAVAAAIEARAGGTWPPERISPLPVPTGDTDAATVRATAQLVNPRSVLAFGGSELPPEYPAALIHGTYDAGGFVRQVTLVGRAADAAVLAKVYVAVGRSTARPVIDTVLSWPSTHQDPYDVVTVHTHSSPAEAVQQAREGWMRVAPNGGLLITGPGAMIAAEGLGTALRSQLLPVGTGFWLRKKPG